MTRFASWHRPSELAELLLSADPRAVALIEADQHTTFGQLRSGAERWAMTLSELRPGDRVVLSIGPGREFIFALLGAWMRDLAVAVPRPGTSGPRAAEVVGARLLISDAATDTTPTVTPTQSAQGDVPTVLASTAATAAAPGAALLMRSSGTSRDDERFVVLSATNLLTVLMSHQRPLALAGQTLLSVLPWAHVFGLVIELLSALMAGARVVRDGEPDRSIADRIEFARAHGVTHACMVPVQACAIAATPGGTAWLRELRGGVVGGARVGPDACQALSGTRLRVGYGLTEAAPGVTLGDPGSFQPGTIGRPVGCELLRGDDGELLVRGSNVCAGFWTAAGPRVADPGRWLSTRDVGDQLCDGTWRYDGRVDHRFKLPNGKMLDVPSLEVTLSASLLTTAILLPCPSAGAARLIVEGDAITSRQRAAISRTVGRLPLEVEATRTLPRTRKGDVDRRALQARQHGVSAAA